VINFTPQLLIPRKEPLLSMEWEAGWAPKSVWAYEDINNIPLPGTEQFFRHLVIINCACLPTEIMVAF
jgi:hypothetical protein